MSPKCNEIESKDDDKREHELLESRIQNTETSTTIGNVPSRGILNLGIAGEYLKLKTFLT